MDQIKIKALAKVNLGLDVLGKRPDGYHEVRMVMQTVHLYDRILLRKTRKPGISIRTNLDFLPVGEENLVYRAAKLMQETYGIKEGISADLEKHIPVAAGLAGGSTDAAAVLYGMNQLFSLGLKQHTLMELGLKIGADVPFCLMRGTALAEGIGEKLRSLPPMPKCPVLIAKPSIGVSTKFVYENLKLDADTKHPNIRAQISAIRQGDLRGVAANMVNVLESVTAVRYPVIEELKRHMMEHGALCAMMSGSGPSVFGLFERQEEAEAAYRRLCVTQPAQQVYLTSVYNNRVK